MPLEVKNTPTEDTIPVDNALAEMFSGEADLVDEMRAEAAAQTAPVASTDSQAQLVTQTSSPAPEQDGASGTGAQQVQAITDSSNAPAANTALADALTNQLNPSASVQNGTAGGGNDQSVQQTLANTGASDNANAQQVQPGTITRQEDGTIIDASGNNALQLKPTDIIQLATGEKVTFGEILGGTMLKKNYDLKDIGLKQREQALEEEKRKFEENDRAWLQALAGDKFAAAYMTNIRNGVDREAALKSAAIAAGIEHLVAGHTAAQQVDNSPIVEGTPKYYLTNYKDLGIEPGTEKYDDWYAGHVAERAAERYRAEKSADDTKAANIEAERTRQANEAREREESVNQIFNLNQSSMKQLPTQLLEQNVNRFAQAGIDVTRLNLTQEEIDTLTANMHASAKANGVDLQSPEWLKQNVITDRDITRIVRDTDISVILNRAQTANTQTAQQQAQTTTQVQQQAQSQQQQTTQTQTPAPQAQQQQSQVQAGFEEPKMHSQMITPPNLIGSRMDKLSIQPILAGAPSNGMTPSGKQYTNDDRGKLEEVEDMLFNGEIT